MELKNVNYYIYQQQTLNLSPMQVVDEINELYDNYKREAGSELSYDAFKMLLFCYPAIVVGASDGEFDETEKDVVLGLLITFVEARAGALDAITRAQFKEVFKDEFDYLLDNHKKWSDSFLQALSVIVKEFGDEIKKEIMKLMNDVANATDGINEKEQAAIDQIKADYF